MKWKKRPPERLEQVHARCLKEWDEFDQYKYDQEVGKHITDTGEMEEDTPEKALRRLEERKQLLANSSGILKRLVQSGSFNIKKRPSAICFFLRRQPTDAEVENDEVKKEARLSWALEKSFAQLSEEDPNEKKVKPKVNLEELKVMLEQHYINTVPAAIREKYKDDPNKDPEVIEMIRLHKMEYRKERLEGMSAMAKLMLQSADFTNLGERGVILLYDGMSSSLCTDWSNANEEEDDQGEQRLALEQAFLRVTGKQSLSDINENKLMELHQIDLAWDPRNRFDKPDYGPVKPRAEYADKEFN